ncbi:MAG: prephenate dehydratase domain-containing protein [Oscillospiraceae bacterium]
MDLKQSREEIDDIDNRITDLFAERMRAVSEVAKYKAENNIQILNAGREREILDRVTGRSGEELGIYTKILFSTLFDLSRSKQSAMLSHGDSSFSQRIDEARARTPDMFPKKAIVACQGVEGAYSQQACDKLFALPSIMYFTGFEAVFNAVEKGMCEYGILPIENSTYGSVNEVYDLMKKYSFYIARSTKLRISHDLLANHRTKLCDIKEIVSHEQALGQCSEFLAENRNIKVTHCENTAVAAKLVAESGRADLAAISSHCCAELYGLSAVKSGIQNSENNYTRFICISKSLRIFAGANKISIMTALPHKPGSLYGMIAKFAALGLNLCKIESRPIEGTDFEFMFYFDIDASVSDTDVVKVIGDMERQSEKFEFLGAYAEV